MLALPHVVPVRQQSEIIDRILGERLDVVLPVAMREAGIDMWLILCQEDDPDPVFKTMIPMNTWTPILQMLIFFDRGADDGIERINLSMTQTAQFYDRPWQGVRFEEQWKLLAAIVQSRRPKWIGINIGSVNWAAGGLTHNLYQQLVQALPVQYAERLVSAETACTRWLMTLCDTERAIYPHVVALAHRIIAECFSRASIMPGVTTTKDLEWTFWQHCSDLGLEQAFKPAFRVVRRGEGSGYREHVIQQGNLVHCDVGLRYLRLNTDHQELAFILRDGETDAPAGLRRLMAENHRLQAIFLSEFRQGRTGNELLAAMLERARREQVPNPRIYSHSLGLFLHQPGPLIGLPWEQERCPGRGDVRLEYDTCFTMELSIEDTVPEWDNRSVRLPTEQDVCFTRDGCMSMDGVQQRFHLV